MFGYCGKIRVSLGLLNPQTCCDSVTLGSWISLYKHPVLPLRVPRLGISLQASLLQIVGYRSLVAEVEKLRREPYDCENPEHEDMLMKVHSSLSLFEEFK